MLLLSRPGEVVRREELHASLWPDGTSVDFEDNLNTAVKRLRDALHDSADRPRFVETIPRRGYRFICPVEELPSRSTHRPRRRVWVAGFGLAILLLLAALLDAFRVREQMRPRPPPGEIRSLAVLPLENLSGDPDDEYFADGMTDALTTELGKISALRVISRQSTMRFRGGDERLPEIARALDVDAVVEGSAMRKGNRVRISAQLVQAAPEQHLWAQSYERNLSDVLALQSEIARAIAEDIRITLTPEESTRLASSRPAHPEAYEAYLRGRYHYEQWSANTVLQARAYYERAIQLDPGDPLPYVGLAETYLWVPIYLSPHEAMATAKPLIERALQLDDTLGEAHAALAAIRFRYEWDWLGALAEFRRALELNPNYAEAHHMYSHLLLALGRYESSLAQSQLAAALDPRSPAMMTHLGTHYVATRQYDLAVEQFHQALALDRGFAEAHYQLGWVLAATKRYGEAISELKTTIGLRGEEFEIAMLGYAYARSGRTREAKEQLSLLQERTRTAYVLPYEFATLYVGLNQPEQALQWIEKGVAERDVLMTELTWDPVFDSLRSEPGFLSIPRRLNLPEPE